MVPIFTYVCAYNTVCIELNFDDAKLWQLWRITISLPNFTLQFLYVTAMSHAMLVSPKFNPPKFL